MDLFMQREIMRSLQQSNPPNIHLVYGTLLHEY